MIGEPTKLHGVDLEAHVQHQHDADVQEQPDTFKGVQRAFTHATKELA